eukprot:CAMPEP_0116575858 /NCGR_PEP_ID=MMETSP0397-20121206/20187_1 /TAXON_ID=216820 /ORGANISM="Cyclophora tenuis, Strain ECT3854" /LENGTH=201 /DNA_ID=CAMNT_0004104789 /DNA_START=217 /DNA_END=822 /DNA_ORIENTATION=+
MRRGVQTIDWIPYYVLPCIYFAAFASANKYSAGSGLTGSLPGWTTSTNWLTATDKCTWYGVTCDASGQIIKIELNDNNLIGVVAPEILILASSLQILNLQDNCLLMAEGVDGNSWIGEMTQLKFLSVGGTSFEFDGIPTYFNTLLQLEHLDVSHTYYFGPIIAESFAGLNNLKYLDIRDNLYTTPIPDSIATLPSLETFLF